MSFSSELIKVLDDLGRRFGIVIDWSNENIMPYLKDLVSRFINWEIVTSIIWLILGVSFIGVFGYLLIKSVKKIMNCNCGDADGWMFLFVISVSFIAIGIIISFCQIFDIARVVYLPELQLYNYISGFLSNN